MNYCHRSGNPLTPDAMYCARCGTQVTGGEQQLLPASPDPFATAPAVEGRNWFQLIFAFLGIFISPFLLEIAENYVTERTLIVLFGLWCFCILYFLYTVVRTAGFERAKLRKMGFIGRVPVWLLVAPTILTIIAIWLSISIVMAAFGTRTVHLAPGESLRVIFD